MGFFTSLNIFVSALTAEQLRTDIIAENIANAHVTRTPDGTPTEGRCRFLGRRP